jgi:exosome complex RNA-binding protein Rrp42 (RNase PH superfamily)
VEHDLVLLEDGVHRVRAGHVVADVEAAAVPVPTFEADPVSQEVEELVEVVARAVVGEELGSML